MKIAAKARIYCHPKIRDSIMAALSQELLKEILEEVIKGYE